MTMNVLPHQGQRILGAYKKKKGCIIRVKKQKKGCRASGSARGEVLLTTAHLAKYQKAKSGQVLDLPFRHTHLVENMKHKGGFLPLLLAALGPVIAGVAGGLIEKGIAGSGIFDQFRQRPSHYPPPIFNPPGFLRNARLRFHHKKKKTKKNVVKKKAQGSGMYMNPWMGRKPN